MASGNPSRSGADETRTQRDAAARHLCRQRRRRPAEARAHRLEAIKRTNDFLATRAPFDAPGFVTFMHKTLAAMPREQAKVRKIPYFDDLLWLVSTSVALHEMDEAALKQHIRQTLENLAAFLTSAAEWPLGHAVDTLGALAAKLDAAALGSEAEALTASLDGIAAALGTGNLAGASGDDRCRRRGTRHTAPAPRRPRYESLRRAGRCRHPHDAAPSARARPADAPRRAGRRAEPAARACTRRWARSSRLRSSSRPPPRSPRKSKTCWQVRSTHSRASTSARWVR